MPTIDADAHVVESEHTWDFMAPSDQKYRPIIVTPKDDPKRQWWMVEGKLRRTARQVVTAEDGARLSAKLGRTVDTTQEAREMENVEVRLRHMDELGIDTQILYSTIFIEKVADTPEAEIAICKGWNRWLADIWEQGKGRLRWVCQLPLLSMQDSLTELKFAKEHGACAIFMRSMEDKRLLQDPYFYPLYQEASNLNMAIGVHIANANPDYCDFLTMNNGGGAYWKFRLASVGACHSLILSGVPELFPKLRIGFIEASAYWMPGILIDLRERFKVAGKKFPKNPFKEYRIYATCQNNDDIPYVIKSAGEDNLVIGTDYGHTDTSASLEALGTLRGNEELSSVAINKILYDNPKALYGL